MRPAPTKVSSLPKDHLTMIEMFPTEEFHGVPTTREVSDGFEDFITPRSKRE